ncbi:MAG: sugar phosphate isomerase/epimerase [Oscillospiraceae bacterium]|nr:sugar phosphate isomerase/epimerase [Oscillospiraceae bacterium]
MNIGYHAVYARDFMDGIDAARQYSFDFVQFDLGVPRFFLDELTPGRLAEIRDYAEDKNVELSFHAPGDNVSLFCDYPMIRAGILDQYKMILEKAEILGARHVTFHPGAYPRFNKSACRTDDSQADYYMEQLYKSLGFLLDNAGKVMVCLENLNFDSLVMRAVERLLEDGRPICLTLDTAKMYTGEREINTGQQAFFTQHKRAIREMHVHDINREFGGHQIIGTGTVDFSFFRQFHHKGVYVNIEVRPVEAAEISRRNLLALWGQL